MSLPPFRLGPPLGLTRRPDLLATRYVTPLREGGSLPAVLETADGSLFVAKFRGAGQGVKALLAEAIAGAFAHAVGLRVPDMRILELTAPLAKSEADCEIQDLLVASVGRNFGMGFLSGALTFDAGLKRPLAEGEASRLVALDTFVANVDRTAKNPNLLWWHDQLWLIDHGAALYWHHGWEGDAGSIDPTRPFALIKDHVLLSAADQLEEAGRTLAEALNDDLMDDVLGGLPGEWLEEAFPGRTAESTRAAYRAYFLGRRAALPALMQEVARVRSGRV